MTKRRKILLALIGLGLTVFLAPVVYSAVSTHCYFQGYRCACGFQNYIFIKDNAYWTYSPGHGRRNRLFTMQAHDGIWEATKGDGEVILQLRFSKGALLEKSPKHSDWQSHPRIYNIWGVWIEGLLSKGDDASDPMPMTVPP